MEFTLTEWIVIILDAVLIAAISYQIGRSGRLSKPIETLKTALRTKITRSKAVIISPIQQQALKARITSLIKE